MNEPSRRAVDKSRTEASTRPSKAARPSTGLSRRPRLAQARPPQFSTQCNSPGFPDLLFVSVLALLDMSCSDS